MKRRSYQILTGAYDSFIPNARQIDDVLASPRYSDNRMGYMTV
jgi:hypothetical protein